MKRILSLAVIGTLALSISSKAISAEKHFRSSVLHFIKDPSAVKKESDSYQYIDDAVLTVDKGKVVGLEKYNKKKHKKLKIKDYRGKIIVPGFVDTHIHFPQTEMIAAYGEQLLEWLKEYTFPTEKKFKDKVN